MTAALPLLLGLAVGLAVVRLALRWRRGPAATRAAPWRLAVLVAAQPACAALLYMTVAPLVARPAGTLIVATRGSGLALTGAAAVALPEAPALAGTERAPDLATALRRHRPARLRITGDGLEPRDIEAARGLTLDFAPRPDPPGLLRLDLPGPVAAGAAFLLGGRVAGATAVDLADPAGHRVDTVVPDAAGDFVVSGTVRAPGPATFTLRVRSGARVIETAPVPVWTTAAAARRLLLLPAAPGPESKFLRRWSSEAGLVVHSQFPTGAGLELGDAPLSITPATLARFDVAVVDARRWAAFGLGERSAMIAAVRGGLGLLVRIDGPLSAPERAALRPLGFAVAGGDDVVPVALAAPAVDDAARLARDGPGSRDAPTVLARDGVPALTRWNVRLVATGVTALVHDARGATIAPWRAEGEGRIAVWPLADSYRLVLAGHSGTYGELWSAALATVGRGVRRATPRIEQPAWVGQRIAICSVAGDTGVVAPDGRLTTLIDDGGCAGFWPQTPGWHRLREAGSDTAAPFVVLPAAALPHVRTAANGAATRQLAAAAPRPAVVAAGAVGGPWPWALAWLVVSGALWWFERSRFGAGDRVGPVQASSR